MGIEGTTLAVTPAATQEHALQTLSGLLIDLAVAVLSVATITIAALSLARASARRREVEVRRAVGASRSDLRVAAVVEGVVLCGLVVLFGVPAGLLATQLAIAAWPGTASVDPVGPVLIATAGIGGVIMGGAMLSAVSHSATSRTLAPSAPPQGLVVPALQLGISLAVLVAAGQLGEAANAAVGRNGSALRVDGHVYAVTALNLDASARAPLYASLLRRLHGTDSAIVSLTSAGMLDGVGTEDLVLTDCGRCALGGLPFPAHPVRAVLNAVSPDTFRALGIPVVTGRSFRDTDDLRAPRVVVVNESLATRHFENGRAVGRRVFLGRNGWYTVVGVVQDSREAAIGTGLLPQFAVYVSAFQHPPDRGELLVQSPARRMETVLGASLNVVPRGTAAALQVARAAPVRWFSRLFGIEGMAAFMIAVLGVFAVLCMWVRGAAGELATRRAVGATRGHVFRFLLARAVAVGIGGVLMGWWLGIMISDAVASVVGALPPRSPGLMLPPALALVVGAIAGALLPGWAVVRATPATLLGSEDP